MIGAERWRRRATWSRSFFEKSVKRGCTSLSLFCNVFANCTFCLFVPLLSSSWPVVRLARCHWLVPNLLPWQAPWPTLGEGGGAEGGDDTWWAVYRLLKAKGVVVLRLQQVNSGRCPAFSSKVLPFLLLFCVELTELCLRSF